MHSSILIRRAWEYSHERRRAADGNWYSEQEFLHWYGEEGPDIWAGRELRLHADQLVYDLESFRAFVGPLAPLSCYMRCMLGAWDRAGMRTQEFLSDYWQGQADDVYPASDDDIAVSDVWSVEGNVSDERYGWMEDVDGEVYAIDWDDEDLEELLKYCNCGPDVSVYALSDTAIVVGSVL